MSQNVAKLMTNTNENAIEKPTTWAISWVNLPEYTEAALGSPKALYWARRGAVKRPHEMRAPDTGQAVRGQRADRVVDDLSIA